MLSASASSWNASLRPPMIAMPMRVTSSPQASGTIAAMGDAEDQQQQHDQDREGDLLALVERVERRLVDRAHERRAARDVGSRRAGAPCRARARRRGSSRRRSPPRACSPAASAAPARAARRAAGRRRSRTGSARRRRGCARAAAPARAPRAPARVPARPGAFSRTAMLIVPPNCRSLSFAARSASVPGICSCVSCRLSRALPARKSATTKAPTQKIRIGTGRRIAKRAICLI